MYPAHRAPVDPMPSWFVATDLDGTLLDSTYPLPAAAAAVDRLLAGDLPVMAVALASSKTLAEMLDLGKLCRQAPFLIFENGAGYAWHPASMPPRAELPEGRTIGGYRVVVNGATYGELRRTLTRLRRETDADFLGFGDMTAIDVAERTGLTLAGAALAKDRLATEPLEWRGSEAARERFRIALADEGLQLIRGGRFWHVSATVDKANAVSLLRSALGNLRLMACGDAPNDLAMLQAADCALLFPGADGTWLSPERPGLVHASKPGPDSWLNAVLRALGAAPLVAEVT